MAKQIDYREVAAVNPAVDAKKIDEFLAYRALMQKAGLYEKPNYRLSPALGPVQSKPAHPNLAGNLKVRVL